MKKTITKNAEIVNAFLEKYREEVKVNNLKINEKKDDSLCLYNYETIIAQWKNGKLHVNMTRYSQTTSKIQNMLVSAAKQIGIDFETHLYINQGKQTLV